jgi:Right handed beta helix region
MLSLRFTHIKAALVLSLVVFAARVTQAQINPNQIDWPTGASGCVYAPGSNTCVAAGAGGFNGGLGTSYQDVTEIPPPANPSAGVDRLYLNSSTHKQACLTSGGADCMPSSGSSTSLISRVNVLSYGAVADGNLAANTGTDNTTAFSNCLTAAIAAKGVCYVPAGVYRIATSMPTVNTSGTGFVGDVWGFTSSVTNGAWSAPITQIFTSSASATILTVSGGAGIIYGNSVKNIAWQRAVTPATGAIGVLVSNAAGIEMSGNTSGDSSIMYDLTYFPNYGGAYGITNNTASSCYTTIAAGAGPYIGFNLHGGANGFQSAIVNNNGVANNCGSAVTSYGFKVDGAIVDLNLSDNWTALVSYGEYFTGSRGQDVHILNSTLDRCYADCLFVGSVTGNTMEFRGGWMTVADTGQTAAVELSSSSGVTISGMQFYANAQAPIIYNHGSASGVNTISNNKFWLTGGSKQSILSNAGTTLAISGNSIDGDAQNFATTPQIQFINQSNSSIQSNWIGNGTGIGIGLDSSSNNNCCTNLNKLQAFTVSDAGTGNSLTTGGTPGGSSGDIQVNNGGAFGVATSPQMVAAINNSPSSAITPTALPDATGSTKGIVKPDGTTCTVTSGVLTCTGSSGGTTIAICADTSGSGTAQVCTTSPSFTPVAGSVIAYTTSTANAGTGLTINVNSLGAKSVAKWQGTTTLAANDILAGKYILMTYDGTNWETSTIGNAPTGGGSFQYSALPVPPAISNFTWVNQQSGTTATQSSAGGIEVNIPGTASLQWQFLKYNTALPATPWRATMYSKNIGFTNSPGNYTDWGLYITDGTKLEGIENLYLNASCNSALAPGCMRVEHVTNVSTDGSTVFGTNIGYSFLPMTGWYVSWCDDGTNLKAQWSLDMTTWNNFYSEAHASYLTATGVGFGGTSGSTSSSPVVVGVLQGWQVSSVANCN